MDNQSEAFGAIQQDAKLILDWLERALEAGKELGVRLTTDITSNTCPPRPPINPPATTATTAEQRCYILDDRSTPVAGLPCTETTAVA